MLDKKEMAKIYDTVISIPGMSDAVKIDLKIPRRNVLLLSKVIERGLLAKSPDDKSNDVLDIVSPAMLNELKGISEELLLKAGLSEVNEKLKTF